MGDIGSEFLRETLRWLRYEKSLGDGALARAADEDLHLQPHRESNSIALIVKHLAGNMVSRWTDFLNSDGEKPDRQRDEEFIEDGASRSQVLERWERGWAAILGAIETLRPDDLQKTVTIRGESVSAVNAIQRQVTHVSYHVGQIVYLAKMLRGEDWTSLSIPRGQSRAYLEKMQGQRAKD